MQKRFMYTIYLIATFLFVFHITNNSIAFAHRGHAGPKKVVLEENDALKTMLPEGGKIIKRKEVLKKAEYKEAVSKWGSSPEEGIYTYYISKDKSGNVSGILFIRSIEYKHGEIEVAIAYDGRGLTNNIKILSYPPKYEKDIIENIQANGFLEGFLHLTTDDIIAKGKEFDKKSEESIQFLVIKEIKGSAILLKMFQGL